MATWVVVATFGGTASHTCSAAAPDTRLTLETRNADASGPGAPAQHSPVSASYAPLQCINDR